MAGNVPAPTKFLPLDFLDDVIPTDPSADSIIEERVDPLDNDESFDIGELLNFDTEESNIQGEPPLITEQAGEISGPNDIGQPFSGNDAADDRFDDVDPPADNQDFDWSFVYPDIAQNYPGIFNAPDMKAFAAFSLMASFVGFFAKLINLKSTSDDSSVFDLSIPVIYRFFESGQNRYFDPEYTARTAEEELKTATAADNRELINDILGKIASYFIYWAAVEYDAYWSVREDQWTDVRKGWSKLFVKNRELMNLDENPLRSLGLIWMTKIERLADLESVFDEEISYDLPGSMFPKRSQNTSIQIQRSADDFFGKDDTNYTCWGNQTYSQLLKQCRYVLKKISTRIPEFPSAAGGIIYRVVKTVQRITKNLLGRVPLKDGFIKICKSDDTTYAAAIEQLKKKQKALKSLEYVHRKRMQPGDVLSVESQNRFAFNEKIVEEIDDIVRGLGSKNATNANRRGFYKRALTVLNTKY
jgi:hypothetical protein